MSCKGCTVGSSKDHSGGCGSSCGCSTGGCNKMNTYDWLAGQNITDFEDYGIVEVTFKQGTRKGFYFNPKSISALTGDHVVVESSAGYDTGAISLSGDLVRLQMKKKNVKEEAVIHSILRVANERDLDKLLEARSLEKDTMIRSRAIARSLGVDMKVGDVEYQGDKRKATFYYIADGRVDFRELIRHYAKEFKVKIEMRQIGSRQESALIGGLGSCGRELCCSTWLSSFKSVSTAAARYQNLAINQAKLSGQCGRLKCCLNFELDAYKEALSHFPSNVDRLYSENGEAQLMKTDVFKGVMYYMYSKRNERGKVIALDIEKVAEIKALNKNNEKPYDLSSMQTESVILANEPDEVGFESVNDVIELPMDKPQRGKRRGRGSRNKRKPNSNKPNQRPLNKKTTKENPSKPEAKGTANAKPKNAKPQSETNPKAQNKPKSRFSSFKRKGKNNSRGEGQNDPNKGDSKK
jgi:cell fate regulator YaaT (PSP1 superfamily)